MVKSARAKRMEKHHKRNMGKGTLNLVSLMDIFTILVFFLLVNSSDVQTLPNAKDMKLPESIAEKKPEETVTILIGKTEILVGTRSHDHGRQGHSVPLAEKGHGDLHGIGLRTDFAGGHTEEFRHAGRPSGIAVGSGAETRSHGIGPTVLQRV
jgi:hypothetical protein